MATLLGVAGGVVAVAVLQQWDWPLLGGYDSGILGLGIIGLAMCGIGGLGFWDAVTTRPGSTMRDGFLVVGAVLGLATTTVLVIGLITATRTPFVWMVVLMAALWVVATARHAVEEAPSGARPAIGAA